MERHFEHELDQLKTNLIRMGNIVDAQLENACDSLFGGNLPLAKEVIRNDAEVDALDTQIDRQCLGIFALTQPVAIDLRLLMSALKINSQLERIGDIAVNIAERVEPLQGQLGFLKETRLSEMAEIARIMVRDSLDSFVRNDVALATRVLASDDVVDNLDRQIFYHLIAVMEEHHDLIAPASHMLILGRHLERMADHATNIAEDVIFLVQARMVKHNAIQEEQQ